MSSPQYPIGALYWCQLLTHDFTDLVSKPMVKQTSLSSDNNTSYVCGY